MTKSEADRPTFKFLAGWLCLDFTNTRNWDSRDSVYERFKTYTDFVWWNHDKGVFTAKETESFLREAQRHPAEAADIFEQSMDLRDVIYEVFAGIAAGVALEKVDLTPLNTRLSQIVAQSNLLPTANGFNWAWAGGKVALERVMWSPLWSAAELLTSDRLDRLKKCAGQSCGWLFLDTSRNHSRRWCEMKHCGNQTKARRHYRRRRASQ